MKFDNSTFKIILIVSIACVFLILANWHILAADAGCPQAPQSLQPSNPSFSKSEIKKIKNYIRQVYGIVGVADEVLDAALGESYEGTPLLWWVGLFVKADQVYELLDQGKEQEALYRAYKFVGKFAFVNGALKPLLNGSIKSLFTTNLSSIWKCADLVTRTTLF